MQKINKKKFLTYEEQICLLKSKNLQFHNETVAIEALKKFGYFSMISGYKEIFKEEKNGCYKDNVFFEDILYLYIIDDHLRNIFLREIIRIEKHIKSLYSYFFCDLYGDNQNDYLNVTNYNYIQYQNEINKFIKMVDDILDNPNRYKYIKHNINKYGNVPLWVLTQSLTLGNISKMYNFSQNKLQSLVAKEFKNVYGNHLSSMLNVLSKFRNVCAHGERLFNYKTKKAIKDLPIHKKIKNYNCKSKNDLFNVYICFKYLSSEDDFEAFSHSFAGIIEILQKNLGSDYTKEVFRLMGFPENWKDVIYLDK